MNEPTKRVTVKILEKDFQVACKPNEKGALLLAAKELDSRMRKVRNSGAAASDERIAVMVALNLCHELQQAHAAHQFHTEQRPLQEQLDQFTPDENLARLADKLERALSKT